MKLTPEQAQDLVGWAGSKSAAARAVGVANSTVLYWLDPAKGRARGRSYRDRHRDRWLALHRARQREYKKRNGEKIKAKRRLEWAEGRHWQQRPENKLRHMQHTTLHKARKAVEHARQRAEEAY